MLHNHLWHHRFVRSKLSFRLYELFPLKSWPYSPRSNLGRPTNLWLGSVSCRWAVYSQDPGKRVPIALKNLEGARMERKHNYWKQRWRRFNEKEKSLSYQKSCGERKEYGHVEKSVSCDRALWFILFTGLYRGSNEANREWAWKDRSNHWFSSLIGHR